MNLTMESDLIEDEWYLVRGSGLRKAVGKYVKTKGNDADFPTFEFYGMRTDPLRMSVKREDVVGRMELCSTETTNTI